jgi:GT2 family glycosyltransferase
MTTSSEPDGVKHATPLVSVVVPVRNRCPVTLRFLARMTEQTYSNLLIIAVDSCSTDGTIEAIKSSYPRVRVVAALDNDYWAGATNRGVRLALAVGSEWILTINDDALVEFDYVERLLAVASANGCLILGSQINYLANPEIVWSLGAQTRWGSSEFLALRFHGLHHKHLPTQTLANDILPVDALPGNGVLINSQIFKSVGFYNSFALPHYHADSEFVMRAISAGFQAWVTPRVGLLNDFSADQKKLPLGSLQGWIWTLSHPKSHLYLPSVIYIYFRYCPLNQKVKTLMALLKRLIKFAM